MRARCAANGMDLCPAHSYCSALGANRSDARTRMTDSWFTLEHDHWSRFMTTFSNWVSDAATREHTHTRTPTCEHPHANTRYTHTRTHTHTRTPTRSTHSNTHTRSTHAKHTDVHASCRTRAASARHGMKKASLRQGSPPRWRCADAS
eukprot:4416109-Prymnesium_polylepis.1